MADSDNDSFFIIEDSNDLKTSNQKVQSNTVISPNSKFFLNSITNRFENENKPMNVLSEEKKSRKMKLDPEFADDLHARDDKSELVIASVVGDKGTGKSFLIDCLITADDGKISRVMSRHPKTLVSTTNYNYRTYLDRRVQFFDASGDVDRDTMLWLYYLSNVVIFNADQKDRSHERHFLKNLDNISQKVRMDED